MCFVEAAITRVHIFIFCILILRYPKGFVYQISHIVAGSPVTRKCYQLNRAQQVKKRCIGGSHGRGWISC